MKVDKFNISNQSLQQTAKYYYMYNRYIIITLGDMNFRRFIYFHHTVPQRIFNKTRRK
jgi:hypothetical protein